MQHYAAKSVSEFFSVMYVFALQSQEKGNIPRRDMETGSEGHDGRINSLR